MSRFSTEPSFDVWRKWRRYVNMSAGELQRFMDSAEGREAGLSRSEARKQQIKSGRESARWILRMLPDGGSFRSAVRSWTPTMWSWARRQNSFIARMRGSEGPLYKDGEMTPKLASLLIWGHDPEKRLRKVPSNAPSWWPGD